MSLRSSAPKRDLRGRPIRVLVVDDSVVIRRLVTMVLNEDPAFEVAGVAANGSIALARIPQVNPDILTLDIEMPEMDGLETLRRVRKEYPKIYVIMFSALTERAGRYTLDALSLGAHDYVTKATNIGSHNKSMDWLRSELLPKIKQFFHAGETPPVLAPMPLARPLPGLAAVQPPKPVSPGGKIKRRIVAIGISTGGPNALAEIMPLFPADFPCPIVIVQHMPPIFTRLLAERLQNQSRILVEEGAEGSRVEPGKALIAPGGFHMVVQRRGTEVVAALNEDQPENSCKPAVDVLFRSVCEVYGGAVIAVVLTGMGQDGLRGVQQLKAHGAYSIAQDKASSVVWGMPGYVAEAGLADVVTSLDNVVPEILRQI